MKNSKEAAAKKEGNLTSQSGGIGMGAGSRLRAIVAARQRQESAERECFAAPSLSSIPDESQLPESTSGGIAQPKGSSCSDEGHLQSCAVPPSPTHSHPRQSLLSAARGCVPGFLPPTPSAMLPSPVLHLLRKIPAARSSQLWSNAHHSQAISFPFASVANLAAETHHRSTHEHRRRRESRTEWDRLTSIIYRLTSII